MLPRTNRTLAQFIMESTGCTSFEIREVVQELWSGYGSILRIDLRGANQSSVILKQVDLQGVNSHPRGWNTHRSHQRKLKSYEVEWNWYSNVSLANEEGLKMPSFLGAKTTEKAKFLLMEDLNASGYPVRKSSASPEEIKSCLTWLARFHANYLGKPCDGLWETGTYWHLATRPDEWNRMNPGLLKDRAEEIDRVLATSRFRTLVHGDAKLANFCFSKSGRKVAAVDFQYVGSGCGMKDVAYFLSGCLSSEECFEWENDLLDHYFVELRTYTPQTFNGASLEEEWRTLYPFAWADFIRFLSGWSPTHYKLHEYGRSMVKKVLA